MRIEGWIRGGRARAAFVVLSAVTACSPQGASTTGAPVDAAAPTSTAIAAPARRSAPAPAPTAASAAPAAALDSSKWPLPRECEFLACKLADGTPGVKCSAASSCGNPCPAGMAPEREGTFCAKRCASSKDCGGDPCSPEGVCDRWPKPLACESSEFCELPGGVVGQRCGPKGRCQSPCKRGHVLYGGTHCAKPCTSNASCPGGECSEGICGPLCPSEGCPYRWE